VVLETVHVIRLILGGVCHRYPDLQIVIGHIGEVLPLMFSGSTSCPWR
jgi:predicted TIM-barrel fold metal-dependent hydrolase